MRPSARHLPARKIDENPSSSLTQHRAPLRIPTPLAFAIWMGGSALSLVLLLGAASETAQAVVNDTRSASSLTEDETPRRDGRGRDEHGHMEQTPEHLRATLPWSNAHSLWGWGSVRFSAEPHLDEIGVITIIDAPRTTRVWTARCEVTFFVDGEEARVRAEPVGSQMTTGDFFDALRLEIGIDVLRRMARAEDVHGDLCGEPFALPTVQRETLRAFVEAFDEMAMPMRVMQETEAESAPVDPDELVEDPDTFLEAV